MYGNNNDIMVSVQCTIYKRLLSYLPAKSNVVRINKLHMRIILEENEVKMAVCIAVVNRSTCNELQISISYSCNIKFLLPPVRPTHEKSFNTHNHATCYICKAATTLTIRCIPRMVGYMTIHAVVIEAFNGCEVETNRCNDNDCEV